MENVMIRDATEADFEAIVKLNAAEVQYTSAMDIERLHYLHTVSDCLRVAVVNEQVVAFMIAMKEHSSYENQHFKWFLARYDRFIYLDRIVVDRLHQGSGIGSLLYEGIFNYAGEEKIPLITCEIYSIPPNHKSLAFHKKYGFKEVGVDWVTGSQKKVSRQVAKVKV